MNKNKKDIERNVLDYIRKNDLIIEGQTVILGVSGGADSVALLLLLNELKEILHCSLVVVHVHHGIRGAEADEDESFVEDLCRHTGVVMESFSFNVPEIAKKEGLTLEEAGRKARYKAFLETAEKYGTHSVIAVAHHMNDQAETVLFHMFRGSSLKGMAGMSPKRQEGEYEVIRPLLGITREEIEYYLKERHQEYRMDSTNQSADYTRNKIRLELLPMAKEGINERTVEHLARVAQELSEVKEYIAAEVLKKLETYVSEEEESLLIASKLNEEPYFLRRELLYMCLERLFPGMKDITSNHIASVEELLRKEVSKKVALPKDIEAVRTYEGIRLQKVSKGQAEKKTVELSKLHMEIMTVDCPLEFMENESNDYTKIMDYDKIKFGLLWRRRQEGDYLVLEDGSHKPLNRYFIDAKIPKEQRDEILLLAEGNHILWVVGHRISADVKVTDETVTILKAWKE